MNVTTSVARTTCACACNMQFRLGCNSCLWLEKMSETSVRIIKNEVRCRDDTVPKAVEHATIFRNPFSGLRKIVACSQPYLAVLSCIYGFFDMVSSLHLTSFLMIFTLVLLRCSTYVCSSPREDCSLPFYSRVHPFPPRAQCYSC